MSNEVIYIKKITTMELGKNNEVVTESVRTFNKSYEPTCFCLSDAIYTSEEFINNHIMTTEDYKSKNFIVIVVTTKGTIVCHYKGEKRKKL